VSRYKVAFVALLALFLVCIPAVADAKFTNKLPATKSQSVSTDTLAPPTGLRFTCFGSGGKITLSWTATADTTYATGYTITGTYGGSSQSVPVTPATATSNTPNYDVPINTSITMTTDYIKTIGTKTTNWSSVSTASLLINRDCA
jgi:hypothetical protein